MSLPERYLPSPEEIRRMCLEIQKEWSPLERRGRMGAYAVQRVAYDTPIVLPKARDRKDPDNDA